MKSKSLARNDAKKVQKIREEIKEAILGKDYELSLVFCKNTLSKKLNRDYRGKDEPTNVLAFPLSKKSGEVFINTEYLKGFTIEHLYIHALLHLKGMRHGAKMESEEKRFLKLTDGKTPKSRNRHRDTPSKGNHSRRTSRRSTRNA
ncbi:MAG: rRNA maturation RNase YbeY [Minisyncoccota bacterium]